MGLKDKARDLMWKAIEETKIYVYENCDKTIRKINLDVLKECERDIKASFDYCTYEFYTWIVDDFEIINNTEYEKYEDRIEEMMSIIFEYDSMIKTREDVKR